MPDTTSEDTEQKAVAEIVAKSRWGIREAAWAICLEAGLFALLFNVGGILTLMGRLAARTGLDDGGRILAAAGAAYPVFLPALSRGFSGLFVAWLASREFGVTLSEFGVRKPRGGILWFILFSLLLAAFYTGGGFLLLHLRPSLVAGLAPRQAIERMGFLWAMVAFCASAPIGEEIIYRGILYRPLRERLGPWKAILISAAVFAVAHNVLSFSLFIPVTQFIGGLILAYAYEKSNSLLFPIVYHACGNALLFALYVMV